MGQTVGTMDSSSTAAAAAATTETADSAVAVTPLESIWDSEHIVKCECDEIGNKDIGKKGWKCMWCGIFFIGVNATKALQHVCKIFRPSVHVRPCRALITDVELKRYRALLKSKDDKKAAKKRERDAVDADITDNQEEVTSAVIAKKQSRRGSSAHSKTADVINVDVDDERKQPAQSTMHSYAPPSANQPTLLTSHEAALDTSIATMIHACNLPLSFGESPLFKKVLHHARLVGSKYTPPKKNIVGGPLLDANFTQTSNKNMKGLLKNADTYGLAMLGDGATIAKKPLFNVLATTLGMPPAVLGVHDSTKHLANGGKKDASYIAKQFLPHMEEMDETKSKIDLFIVDGASNVQKGGDVVQAVFKRVTVLHGAEHVLALYFDDISKIPEIKVSPNYFISMSFAHILSYLILSFIILYHSLWY